MDGAEAGQHFVLFSRIYRIDNFCNNKKHFFPPDRKERENLFFSLLFLAPVFRRRIEETKPRLFLHRRLSLSRFPTPQATRESYLVPLSEAAKAKHQKHTALSKTSIEASKR